MKIYADLHIHSKYSRATSKNLDIQNLEKWARVKGINLLGTGDFSHPEWIKEIKKNLQEDETGILKTRTGMNFVLQNEISLIYTQNSKGRRVHLVILSPNIETTEQITEFLKKRGRVDYDGRPIFKISCEEITYELKKINKQIEVIPAHIWTPWFGVLGEKSGFNSLKEAFGDQIKNIHAIETGLSSDPPMNWRIKELDNMQLISNSDSHSFWPWRIGREANIFNLKKLTYNEMLKAIRTGEGLEGTIEVDPAYGKYHFTGHRDCKVSFEPKQAKKFNDICPVCKKKLTIGVMERVEELATRPENEKPKSTKPFYRLLPLSELISFSINKAVNTKSVWSIYNKLIKNTNELDILLNKDIESMNIDKRLAELILKNRRGEITIQPGYDGVYGKPILKTQKSLKDF